jgi:hypothetical protein
VHTVVTKPRRGDCLGVKVWDIHGVVIATADPLKNAGAKVVTQACLVTTPHLGGWVVSPALGLAGESAQNLIGLYTLLTEAGSIKVTH